MHAMTIGVDLAKTRFELALANRDWRIVARQRLTRAQFERFLRTQPAAHLVMEACASAHFWARTAQAHGHRVTLIPPQYVRPYVRRNKTDRTDAEAVLEAIRSDRLAPVTVKTVAQQEVLALHRVRIQWMATRTARINALRGLLHEHGYTLPRGAHAAVAAAPRLLEDAELALPARLRFVLAQLVDEIRALEHQLQHLDRQLAAVAKADAVAPRLLTVPGVGVITATALVGAVGHIQAFGRARQFACWLGLTPREHSTGARRRLGRISKQGDVYLRCLLTHGARAVLQAAHRRAHAGRSLTRLQQWGLTVEARRGHNKATIALANKLARILWAVWTRDDEYRTTAPCTEAA